MKTAQPAELASRRVNNPDKQSKISRISGEARIWREGMGFPYGAFLAKSRRNVRDGRGVGGGDLQLPTATSLFSHCFATIPEAYFNSPDQFPRDHLPAYTDLISISNQSVADHNGLSFRFFHIQAHVDI